MQIDFLVFQGAPEPLRENIVQGSSFAIHTDLHPGIQQQLGVLWTGKMTALIAVTNLRRGLRQSPLPKAPEPHGL